MTVSLPNNIQDGQPLTSAPVMANFNALVAAINGIVIPPVIPPVNLTINAQTGTAYTLVAADANNIVTMNNGAANTVTIPTGVLPVGCAVVIIQMGAGQTTVAPTSPDALYNASSAKTRAQYSVVVLYHLASGVWLLSGDMA